MKPKQHPKTHLTKNERIDLIRHLLRPCEHRGKLHKPKEVHIGEGGELDKLASDIAYWLGHKSLALQVVTSKPVDSGWHAALTNDGGIIEIDQEVAGSQPFVAGYFTVIGVLQIIVWRYSHVRLHHNDNQKLLEHMSIAAGLGVYGINALHQPKVHYIDYQYHKWHDEILSVPATSYLNWFKGYTSEHNIPLASYEEDLLPSARKSLGLPPLEHPSKNPLITHAVSETTRRRDLLILSIAVAIFVVLLGYIAWERMPRPLTDEQQAKLSQVAELEAAYYTCQSELQQLVDAVKDPDIPNRRSIQTKAKACEQLRYEHNQLVRQIKLGR